MVSKTFSKYTCLALLSAPFMLTACGEGYELIKTDTMFPYGNQRTAGSGYAYVLAKMLPEKEVKLQTVKRDWTPEVKEAAPVVEPKPAPAPEPTPEPTKGDEVFTNSGKK